MKLLSARIKGLIGLSRGSDIDEIYIDFTKCKNKLILIMGPNGSGKTSLMSVLHPLPDSQSMYIAKEEGSKDISYMVNGIIYNVSVQYPVNKFGERTTTKAYMQKVVNGETIELNPNGNVTSYKECVYTEFKLDSNYEALTRLSITDKGIVTKTPAERIKFVSSIVRETEAYTNIYKALNKRSSIFKSMINSLVSKIDSIGSQENIEHTLSSIDLRLDALSKKRDQLLKNLSSAESLIMQLDTDGKIQSNYNELYTQLEHVKEQIGTIEVFIKKYLIQPYDIYTKDKITCSNSIIALEKDIIVLSGRLDAEKAKLQTLLMEKEEDAKILNIKTNKMQSLRSQYNFDELIRNLKYTNDRISAFKSLIKELGLTEETTLSKDEFILGLSTMKDIKRQIDSFRSFSYDDQIRDVIYYARNSLSPVEELKHISLEKERLTAEISDIKSKISYFEGLVDKTTILAKRPDKCKLDECPFIADALKASQQDPLNQIDALGILMNEKKKERDVLSENEKNLNEVLLVLQSLNTIIRMINNNRHVLDKLPNGHIFSDVPSFLECLESGATFNEINDLYNYIDQANMFEQYRVDKEAMIKLESEYEIYKNRSIIIDEISSDIEVLQKNLSAMVQDVERLNENIFNMEKDLQNKSGLLSILQGVNDKYEKLEELNKTKDFLEESIRSIYNNMQAIEQAVKDVNQINAELLAIDGEINPLKDERESLRFSISKLKEYNDELAVFSSKYNKIEVIKKYSNPTTQGIQQLFVDMYMGQTLEIANKLLSMFFNGRLKLLQYKLDANQFKIPCSSAESSIPNDDISSCSDGEKSVLSVILSVALLQQSSTLYNIFRFDEVNGTLDQSNKAIFLELLYLIAQELGIENCLMISHASESVLNNVDIICLRTDSPAALKGNVIYSIEK